MHNNLPYADHRRKGRLSDLQIENRQSAKMEKHERLKLARQLKHRTAKAAAEAVSTPYGTYSGHEAGTRGFDEDLARYARAFGVSKAWLAFGEGPMKPSLVKSFDPDAPDDDPAPADTEAAEAARRAYRKDLGPGEVIERDARGGAGVGSHSTAVTVDGQIVDGVSATWRFPQSFLHSELRARENDVDMIPVDGDSMIPTLLPGDRVMIQRSARAPSPDGIFAISDGIGISVKRLQIVRGSDPLQVRILSDNPMHIAETIAASDLNVIGRVIMKVTRL